MEWQKKYSSSSIRFPKLLPPDHFPPEYNAMQRVRVFTCTAVFTVYIYPSTPPLAVPGIIYFTDESNEWSFIFRFNRRL